MQPYQEASQEVIRQKELPGKAMGSIAKTAAGIAGGGAILNRVMPFLNKYISPDLAIKGLNKIDPRLGKFVSGAMNQGMSAEDVGSFIKEKVTGEKTEQEPSKQPQQSKNIIEEHAPEVHEILVDKIGQGFKPLVAALQISEDRKFKRKILDLQKKTGKNFSDLVTAVFGGDQIQKPQQNPQKSLPQQPGRQLGQDLIAQHNPRQQAQEMISQHQQQQPQAPQQSGVNPQLMQALQLAAQSRQRRQQQ